jgi:hypothetical protein
MCGYCWPLTLLCRQRIRHGRADIRDRERLGHDIMHQRIQVRGALALVGKAGIKINLGILKKEVTKK